jgi:SPP1 family predicted phage head-tail adaptor
MNPGELRHRIRILKSVTVTNDNGFEEPSYQEVCNPWAKANSLFGKEYYAAAAVQAQNTVEFTIRYRTDLTREMIIEFQGKQYNVTDIDDKFFLHQYLVIKALEVPNNG